MSRNDEFQTQLSISKQNSDDYCDCEDCIESDPCMHNCDVDSRCQGCEESALEREEIEFEIDCARGRR
jgi:hypothetical protein